MFRKILELIVSIGKWFFNPVRMFNREVEKINDKYKEQKEAINEAISGKEDINIITDDIIGDIDTNSFDNYDIGLSDKDKNKKGSGSNRKRPKDSRNRQKLLSGKQGALPEIITEDSES
jgi:hypothetical protein